MYRSIEPESYKPVGCHQMIHRQILITNEPLIRLDGVFRNWGSFRRMLESLYCFIITWFFTFAIMGRSI